MPQQVADSMHAYGVIKMRVLSRRLGMESRVACMASAKRYGITEGAFFAA